MVNLCCVVVLAAAVALHASADDTMRCANGKLVNVGMVDAEVRARCGEPKNRTVTEQPVRTRGAGGGSIVVGSLRAERWIYERGPGQFDASLSFEDGKLVGIELLQTR
jgi:hypothetical protein